jgi:flavin reductase (DIM6/NTAB) family NADH-FMN oxidoreductase RutF
MDGFFWTEIANSVSVIGSVGKRRNIMAASWIAPVSFDPPLLMVSVSPERYSHGMIMKGAKFGVSILAEDQVDVSRKAGGSSGVDDDKLKGLDNFDGPVLGVPLIRGAAATFECKLKKAIPAGDHTLFVGEIEGFERSKKKPLVLYRKEYLGLGGSNGGYF